MSNSKSSLNSDLYVNYKNVRFERRGQATILNYALCAKVRYYRLSAPRAAPR